MFNIITDYINKNIGNIFISFIHNKVKLVPIMIMYINDLEPYYSTSIPRRYSTQEELDALV